MRACLETFMYRKVFCGIFDHSLSTSCCFFIFFTRHVSLVRLKTPKVQQRRSVYTTGKGSTGVGLTATVNRDNATGEVPLKGPGFRITSICENENHWSIRKG